MILLESEPESNGSLESEPESDQKKNYLAALVSTTSPDPDSVRDHPPFCWNQGDASSSILRTVSPVAF